MNFLENIFQRLHQEPSRTLIKELLPEGGVSAKSSDLLDRIAVARAYLTSAGLRKGDRCAILAPNSINWAALDLAAMAEGLIVVPFYARQAPSELVGMMRDCQPAAVCCADAQLRDAVCAGWPDGPRAVLFSEIFAAPNVPGSSEGPLSLADRDPLTIIYTSGTSGEPKGVVLNVGNVSHILSCTAARLDLLMGATRAPDTVFHYLPFCFAASWITMLSCLSRNSVLHLAMDLTRLADDLRAVDPDYCVNVPAVLERMRTAIEQQIARRGGFIAKTFAKAKAASLPGSNGHSGSAFSLTIARALIFPTIRKKLAPGLKALICGSAPLSPETQLFFSMLRIPVLQVYGLTETTAICTMDDPHRPEPGAVGPAIPGIEMKLGEAGEILVRGPNIFPGYWNRPLESALAVSNGWFHTGDQGELTPSGNWRIIGRLKNLIILSSGHNIAPEPLEQQLAQAIPGAQQVLLFGNGRSYLSALITGEVRQEDASAQIERLNSGLPHYRRIHAFHLERQPLTIESGLLTANGKLRRDAVAARFRDALESMYRKSAQ